MHAAAGCRRGQTVHNTAAACHRTAPPRLALPSESRKKSAWRLTRRCSSFGSISLTSNRCADTACVMLMGIEPQFSKPRPNQDSARAHVSRHTNPRLSPSPPPRPPAKHTCVLGEDAHYGLLGASVRQSRHEPEDGMRRSSHDARLQAHHTRQPPPLSCIEYAQPRPRARAQTQMQTPATHPESHGIRVKLLPIVEVCDDCLPVRGARRRRLVMRTVGAR